jgi:hypothetical protein
LFLSHAWTTTQIKPSNLLLNLQGACKLADFGVSGQLEHANEIGKSSFVGTVTYMSVCMQGRRPPFFDFFRASLCLIPNALSCSVSMTHPHTTLCWTARAFANNHVNSTTSAHVCVLTFAARAHPGFAAFVRQ